MAQKGLGKGLGALLGDFVEEPTSKGPYSIVPIYKIEPNPNQPRHEFKEEELQELADSISIHGLIQPLTVRKMENGYFQIIAGERRWRAARLANFKELPIVEMEADDRKVMELALIENLQRQDLNPIEEAMGFQSLIKEYGLTQEETSEQVGKSRSAIANALRLLALPEEIRKSLADGKLTAGHARAILSVKDEKKQKEVAQKIIALDLSVRQSEMLCKNLNKTPKPEKTVDIGIDYVAECEKSLSKKLGRGVKITNGKRKGKFELEFYGQEDLQVLIDALMKLN